MHHILIIIIMILLLQMFPKKISLQYVRMSAD